MLNRYLDIYEVIEDPEQNNIPQDDDLSHTDIPSPFDVDLPEKNIIAQKEKDEIKDLLLNVSQKKLLCLII